MKGTALTLLVIAAPSGSYAAGGCATPPSVSTPTVKPSAVPSQPPAASSTAVPATVTQRHEAIPSPGATWNYSVLGDSSAWGFPTYYAQYIEADLGVNVNVLMWARGDATIIRTHARFMPFYRVWRDTGNFDEFRRCVAALDEAIFEVGAEHGILVVDAGVVMNRPNHDQDPFDKGYLADGVHENDAGAEIVAGVFRQVDYEPIIP